MSDLEKLKTEIALLKKDAKTGELIHQRLEIAVDKLTEITISLKGMIAQQQTKLERAEQTDDDIFVTLEARRKEWDTDLKELHSRISTQARDLRESQYQSENKLLFKVEDRPEYLRSRNLEHFAELRDFFLDLAHRYWFYYTTGGGDWFRHPPVRERPKYHGPLRLKR